MTLERRVFFVKLNEGYTVLYVTNVYHRGKELPASTSRYTRMFMLMGFDPQYTSNL